MSTPDEVPELVSRALHQCLLTGWLQTTRNETGRLLATLAAGREGTIAEASTGGGAGVAWLRSGAPQSTHVVCVEQDPERAEQARQTLQGADVEVLDGGCETLRARGPFSLLYLSRRTAELISRDLAWQLVEPGGVVVIDDFDPSPGWPPREVTGAIDTLRQGWLSDERFTSSEVAVAPDLAVVLATKN
ncbi:MULTISPECIES: O-methyltransferase [unclassified Luteococcus]|uniref:O-methyltransferase n=1 Tax=unclassified Luteococcus TaxID=2639923 RepID=UPI00313E1F4C